jgi:DNA-binding CsgD family transcriptional regulator
VLLYRDTEKPVTSMNSSTQDPPAPSPGLRGRGAECEALDALLDTVRTGASRALVLRGEPGVGKTALLEYAIDRATGCHVSRAAGIESEMELAFAGLHQLCAPMLDGIDGLPAPQRDALGTALGLRTGEAPDRFLVGLAVLGLLSEAAEEQPLVCVVDDAQWLDRASAQALAFVARRLLAEPIAMVFAVREPSYERELTDLPELLVNGLGDADARALLNSVIRGPLDEHVRDRIVHETRGNPLALLELPRGLTPAQLAGGFGLQDALPLSNRIEESFRHRLEPLADSTQQLLLVAAAEPVGDPVLVWQAAAGLGISPDAAAPAEAAGLLTLGTRVTFHHPLVRSAVYRGATVEERQIVHRALADATDAEVDPDRRAWHLSRSASGPQEDVAGELERSAGRAQARGGLSAAAAFLEQAARLTIDPARRAERSLAAAQAKHLAGAQVAALGLLAAAKAGPVDEFRHARVDLLRAQIAFSVNRGSDAPSLLLKAARQLEPLDIGLARETYLEALSAAMFVGCLARGADVLEVAQAARTVPPPEGPPRPTDLLLDGLALLITEGFAAGTPMLEQALRAFRDEPLSREEEIRWLSLACNTAALLWDDEAWNELSARHVEVARDAGALAALPMAMSSRIAVHLNAGEFAAAAALVEEVDAVTGATGSQIPPYGAIALAACQGREEAFTALVDATAAEAMARDEGIGLGVVRWATAVLYNGLGRYDEALDAALQAGEHPQDTAPWLAELVEAAARSGNADVAGDALRRLCETTSATGTDWAIGLEAYCRALVSEGDVAEELYVEAIDRLGRSRAVVPFARARLVYGEWLRRERRRVEAREHLRAAHELFAQIGLGAFAERAARELQATGETARKRTLETSDELTAQEAQIARLAGTGLSNPEIGGQLFISPRTVEYHLHKVFGKLGISSRRDLESVLPDGSQPVFS